MKKIKINRTLYQCEVCKTEYKKEADAKSCEKMLIKEEPFKVGDQVQNVEPRQCNVNGKIYFFKGRVIKVVGPMPFDEEYERKWLGADPTRLNSHVYAYQVEFRCPHCRGQNAKQSAQYYSPELKLI
ncbi:MAG: hypothetical protein HY226_00950 [Candidatus Vogelbacteria bacterium]|nr:hypothetical protein [Candidatus Vogelbacteria bacterium]